MSTALSVLFTFIGVSIAVWLVSFIMEALRPGRKHRARCTGPATFPSNPWRWAATRCAISGPARVPTSSFSTRCERN